MRIALQLAALVAAASRLANGIALDTSSADSIKSASATIVNDMMSSYYVNNQSATVSYNIGTFGMPYYWWESAAVWSGLIDYWAYTGDASYNPTVIQALQAQSNNSYMPPSQEKDEGNSDQVVWALACMDALEYGFPSPAAGQPGWLELATQVWSTQVARWDNATCSGGLRWQIYSFNAGYDYKNSQSNGGFFLLSARLARYTGNQTYANWAGTTYDWMNSTGLVADGNVYDGTDADMNCQKVDLLQFTIDSGLMLYGSALLYNMTGSSLWQGRVTSLLTAAKNVFFSEDSNVMIEYACESVTPTDCTTDQYAFKSYLGRYLTRSTLVAPFVKDQVVSLMTPTAQAAALYCNAGSTGRACTTPFYSGYRQSQNNTVGLGQSLSALSVIQSLLLLDGATATPRTGLLKQGDAASTSTSGSNGTTSTGSGTATTSSKPPSQSGAGIKAITIELGSVGLAACLAVLIA